MNVEQNHTINTPYQPIDCDFYDVLEALSVRRETCDILIQTANGDEQRFTGIITNLYARGGEEFLVLNTTHRIRLDQLLSVNGSHVPGVCSSRS